MDFRAMMTGQASTNAFTAGLSSTYANYQSWKERRSRRTRTPPVHGPSCMASIFLRVVDGRRSSFILGYLTPLAGFCSIYLAHIPRTNGRLGWFLGNVCLPGDGTRTTLYSPLSSFIQFNPAGFYVSNTLYSDSLTPRFLILKSTSAFDSGDVLNDVPTVE